MASSVKSEILLITSIFCLLIALTIFSVMAQGFLKTNTTSRSTTYCSAKCSLGVNATVIVIGDKGSLPVRLEGFRVMSIERLDRDFGKGIYVVLRPLSREELLFLKKILLRGYPVVCVNATCVSQVIRLIEGFTGVHAVYNGTGVYLFKLFGPDEDRRYSLFEKGYGDHRVTCDVLCDAVRLLANHVP